MDLPPGVMSSIVNSLPRSDQAGLRAASVESCQQANASVQMLHAAPRRLSAVAKLLRDLPALQNVSLDTHERFSPAYDSYEALQGDAVLVADALASLRCCTSLQLGSRLLQQLGALKWAWHEAEQVSGTKSATASSSSQQPYSAPPTHLVLGLPEWLAAPPNLQHLTIQASQPGTPSPRPVCLWVANAWGSKLTALHLAGVAAPANLPAVVARLPRLERLALADCSVPEGRPLAALLQRLSSCAALSSLELSRCGVVQLPNAGWSGVTGLKVLDVSRNSLSQLPVGLSGLQQLTALRVHHNQLSRLPQQLAALQGLRLLDASHNWLSGGCGGWMTDLMAAWPRLEVLALQNCSDKRGSLQLPPSLTALQQLWLGDNHAVDLQSLTAVVQGCKELRLLGLTGSAPALSAGLRALLAARPDVKVVW